MFLLFHTYFLLGVKGKPRFSFCSLYFVSSSFFPFFFWGGGGGVAPGNRAVGNDHFCDTTQRASQKGFPCITDEGIDPLIPQPCLTRHAHTQMGAPFSHVTCNVKGPLLELLPTVRQTTTHSLQKIVLSTKQHKKNVYTQIQEQNESVQSC